MRFRFAISCGFGIDSGTGAWPLQDSLRYVNSAPLYRKALCFILETFLVLAALVHLGNEGHPLDCLS